jgi:protein ImuB
MLGIQRVGDFLELPSGGVRRRFGPETERLYRFASGVLSDGSGELPLQPQEPERTAVYTVKLPMPSSETLRLLDAAARCLDSLLQATEARQEMVRELCLLLETEEEQTTSETLTPAVPTRDRRLLLELIALRLEGLHLPGPAAVVTLSGAYIRETVAQQELFAQRSGETRTAAALAFARLRAVFGNQAVQRACLEDEHLPERSYRWERLERLPDPPPPPSASRGRAPAETSQPPAVPAPGASRRPHPAGRLIRRVYPSPAPLPDPPGRRGLPAFRRLWGPYLLSGHWWEWEVSREYYYAENTAGVLLWLYRDRHTRRWWVAGRVE